MQESLSFGVDLISRIDMKISQQRESDTIGNILAAILSDIVMIQVKVSELRHYRGHGENVSSVLAQVILADV
jgi:hypothetical protein